MKKTAVGMSVALATVLAAASAQAAFIDGSFSMVGGFDPSGGSTLSTATGIDFRNPSGGGVGQVRVDGARTGDFVTLLADGQIGVIKDFTFNPFSGPINNFYQIGAVTFDLVSLSVPLQSNTFLLIEGEGTVKATGYDDTPGVWNFSGQDAGNMTFSWSASTATQPPQQVPEPATLAVVGLGLTGLGLMARRRKRS